jgi:hypothetical protein
VGEKAVAHAVYDRAKTECVVPNYTSGTSPPNSSDATFFRSGAPRHRSLKNVGEKAVAHAVYDRAKTECVVPNYTSGTSPPNSSMRAGTTSKRSSSIP